MGPNPRWSFGQDIRIAVASALVGPTSPKKSNVFNHLRPKTNNRTDDFAFPDD